MSFADSTKYIWYILAPQQYLTRKDIITGVVNEPASAFGFSIVQTTKLHRSVPSEYADTMPKNSETWSNFHNLFYSRG